MARMTYHGEDFEATMRRFHDKMVADSGLTPEEFKQRNQAYEDYEEHDWLETSLARLLSLPNPTPEQSAEIQEIQDALEDMNQGDDCENAT